MKMPLSVHQLKSTLPFCNFIAEPTDTGFNRQCANYVIRSRTRSKHDVIVLINNEKILKLVFDSSDFLKISTQISVNKWTIFLNFSTTILTHILKYRTCLIIWCILF